MGSVKDLEILESPSPESPGRGIFHFSDRYSVFDWGEMPEKIHRKGEALAMMGAFTFEKLEERGIETHYLGMEEDEEVKTLEDLREPSDKMHFRLVNLLEPEFVDGEYDYSIFQNSPVNNYLIPLEIIFRNRIPEGSSARRRYSPRDIGLEIEGWPAEPVSLDEPIVEASTKLEEQDRYIDDREAEEISGVRLDEIYSIARKTNRIITKRAGEAGMTHEDGKIELLYIDGEIVVGDVAGTFDENRFTVDEMHVSKEVLRQAYKDEQSEWYEEISEAKSRSKEEGIKNWKKLVDTELRALGVENLVSEMYQAGANRYIGKNFFDVRGLETVLGDLKSAL